MIKGSNVFVFIRQPRLHREMARFIRFFAVGMSGTLVDFAVLTLLKQVFGVPTLPANVVSYTAGAINNFWLNRTWTFSGEHRASVYVQFAQFLLISLIGLTLNTFITHGLEQPMGALIHNPTFGYIPAKIAATLIVLFWNFMANRLWTFRGVVLPAAPGRMG